MIQRLNALNTNTDTTCLYCKMHKLQVLKILQCNRGIALQTTNTKKDKFQLENQMKCYGLDLKKAYTFFGNFGTHGLNVLKLFFNIYLNNKIEYMSLRNIKF